MSALAATVRDNDATHRYDLLLDGELVGDILYRTKAQVVTLIHTEIAPRLEGRVLGEQLVAGALDDIRERGLQIVPLSPSSLRTSGATPNTTISSSREEDSERSLARARARPPARLRERGDRGALGAEALHPHPQLRPRVAAGL